MENHLILSYTFSRSLTKYIKLSSTYNPRDKTVGLQHTLSVKIESLPKTQENIESLSTKVESSQTQIEWRRSKVAELDSQGHSQPEISRILQVSIGTINRDIQYLRQQAKYNIKKYIDERLPEQYEKCLVGLNA
jgi:Trp operon repressor